jgi:MFS family permease
VPDRPAEQARQPVLWREIGKRLSHAPFARFALTVGVLQLGLGMTAPLLPLFWVRRLGATDSQVSIVMTLASGALVIGALLMRRAVGKLGRERMLAIGTLGYMLYPLLTSLSPNMWWLFAWAALSGIFNAAVSVTLFENLVSVTPVAERTSFIGVYNVIVNLALFAGPLFASWLATTAAGPAVGLRVAAAVLALAGVLFAARQPLAAQ